MRVHLFAVGSQVVPDLAMALLQAGHEVSISSNDVPGVSRERLAAIKPLSIGWPPEIILQSMDVVVVGPSASPDDPHLSQARRLQIPIQSLPEFIGNLSEGQTRIVVAGTHGKSTVLAMAMHCLRRQKIDFDYVVGETVEGFESSVRLSGAPFILLDGDENPASLLDPTPAMVKCRPNVAVVTGIHWFGSKAYPSPDEYRAAFEQLIAALPPGANFIWNNQDTVLRNLVASRREDAQFFSVPYEPFPAIVQRGTQIVKMWGKPRAPMQAFGEHNLANAKAAFMVCREMGVWMEDFLRDLASYKGLPKRLEPLATARTCAAWSDAAHTPASVAATVDAVKTLFPERPIVACLELQNLAEALLGQFAHALDKAEQAFVLTSQQIPAAKVQEAFQRPDLQVFTSMPELERTLEDLHWLSRNLLFMSAGNFGGVDLSRLARRLFS